MQLAASCAYRPGPVPPVAVGDTPRWFVPCERAVARSPRSPGRRHSPPLARPGSAQGVTRMTGVAEAQCLGVAGVLLPAGDTPFDPCQKPRAPGAPELRRSQSKIVQTGV